MIFRLIAISLEFEAPWSISAPERAELEVDLPCSRDPFGKLTVPGTAVAGSLRDHVDRALGRDAAEVWFGVRTLGDDDHRPLQPSRVRVLGSQIAGAVGPTTVVRRTAIDARRGAARAKSLHAIETAPQGTRLELYLRCDEPTDGGDSPEGSADDLLDALWTWRPSLGRGRTSGMGRARVTSVRSGVVDLGSPGGLRRWIGLGGPQLFEGLEEHVGEAPEDPAPLLTVDLRADDAVMVGGGRSEGNRSWPYVRAGTDEQIVEGSSLKGLFRSRVGFILRSSGVEACDEHTGCGRPACPVCWLFGSTSRRGRVRVRSTALTGGRAASRTHVSLDRFTGGARASQLFTEEDLKVGASMKLVIDRDEKAGDPPAWVPAVLAWVVLDLHDGYVGIGGRTSRGLGTVRVVDEGTLAELRDAAAAVDLVAAVKEWQVGMQEAGGDDAE